MSTVKELLKIACLVLLCAVLAPFAWNSRATYRKVAAILLHVDGTAGEMKRAAQKSVTASEHTDEAIVAFGELVTDADKVMWKGDDAVDAATGLLNQGTATTKSFNDSLVPKLGTAIDQFATIPPNANTALVGIAPLLAAYRNVGDDADKVISSPKIDTLLGNVDAVTANTARATNDLANKEHDLFYPPPCTGKLCPVKKVWRVGRAVIGLAEPAYYGVGIARGQ